MTETTTPIPGPITPREPRPNPNPSLLARFLITTAAVCVGVLLAELITAIVLFTIAAGVISNLSEGTAAAPDSSIIDSEATGDVGGESAFRADVKAAGFGSKDANDPGFVDLGYSVCKGFGTGVSFREQRDVFIAHDAHPSVTQAESLITAAVSNLCPEFSMELPP